MMSERPTESETHDPDLTHWGLDEMDTILQMTVSIAFSWMKITNFD